jgi:uncharacterized oxidoreductase
LSGFLSDKKMKLINRTILITGGSSGIGFEFARQLIAQKNIVIVCGRSHQRLLETKVALPDVHIFTCDIARQDERDKLLEFIRDNFSGCNVLINNAAIVHKTNFRDDADMLEKTDYEIQTNLMAPIALAKMILPLFEKQTQSAIINITTGLVYAPRAVYPIYNATKSGLHAFTQALRYQLKKFPIRVIEVMMPVVDTPWHKGEVPKIAITSEKAVREAVTKIESGDLEVRVGKVKLLYLLSRIAPGFAFRRVNNI